MIKDPGRMAWTVISLSLIIFCLVATSVFLGIRWFLFESTIPVTVALNVSRDTVIIRTTTGEGAERASRLLSRDANLTTDSSSQGFITFTDPYTHELIASLTLQHDSAIEIGEAARPRFEFSDMPYTITVRGLSGTADVDIVPDNTRQVLLDLYTDDGFARLGAEGLYTLTARNNNLAVFNRTGDAIVVHAAGYTRSIPQGMEGALTPDPNNIRVYTPSINIVPDSTFDTVNPANNELSSSWGCYNLRDDQNSPLGQARREVINGRSVMHLVRTSEAERSALNHAETGCLQYLNTAQEPLPITAYNYLELRATLQIKWQPDMLNVCGQQGSECPIMLVINYIDKYGNELRWIHGFYSRYEASVGWPLRCDSCAQDHERVNQDTWFTYTSGNLLQLLPDEQRPVAINSIEFYASGHEYEILLREVALLAGTRTPTDSATPQGTQG